MTDSRWLNEYDRKFWTWLKNLHWQTLTFKLDWKYNKYYHNDENYHVNMTEIHIKVHGLNDFNSYILILVKFIYILVKFKG